MTEKPTTVYELAGKEGNLTLEYMSRVNYSMYHNASKTLIKCTLNNDSGDDWQDITISLSGEMLNTSNAHINTVAAKTSVDLTNLLSIDIDPNQLIQLSEGINTNFTISVTIEGDKALKVTLPLELMAYDQWPGFGIRPELLATFVTPNHPILTRISTNASRFMEKFTGSPDLDEYQSQDPNRVRAQVASVFEALRSEGLIYASVPASFEKTGQRVRTVEKVLDEKLGTCLDLSLLVASCLESIGINPLLVITSGHCMVGAWLVKDSYMYPTGDDVDYILKCASDGLNEIVVFESTSLTSGENVSFDASVASAMQTLKKDQLVGFVDVYRSRVNGIRPLPLRINGSDGWHIVNEGIEHTNSTTTIKEYDRYDLTSYASDEVQLTKYDIWERKLLDFSLRNNLLNMRQGRKIIPLVSFLIDKLEDYMQAGETFKVMPFPLDKAPERTAAMMLDSSQYPELEDYLTKEMENKRIHSFLPENELKEALKFVYRASRTSLEENGANNLYLVLGVLKWYETDKSQQPRFAPILLLPIEIIRSGGINGYVIRTRDEDTVLNITLTQLLKQQYGIDLTVLDELPKDESGVDVKKIFAIVRDKIRNNKGWNVLDESMIGLFSFNKFVMWNDIHTNSAKLHANEIISSLVEGKLNITDIEESRDAKEADNENKPHDFTIPIDVDSSQLEAVIASGEGKSFILHGPPGTGKSQTITNMIANALYQGKRVLFVAEKMAALSVVQSRLDKIGLAPFCLELHSNKVTKRHFLGQMESALDITRYKSPDDFKKDSEDIYNMRRQLIEYIEALHLKGSNGLSLYDCITSYLSTDGDQIDIDITDTKELGARGIDKISDDIERLDTIFRISGKPNESPLYDLDLKDGSTKSEEVLRSGIATMLKAMKAWSAQCNAFSSAFGLEVPDTVQGIDWAIRYLHQMMDMEYCSSPLLAICAESLKIEELKKAIKAGVKAEKDGKNLSAEYTKHILRLKSQNLEDQWQRACAKWFLPRFFAKRSILQMMSAYKVKFSEADLHTVIGALREIEESQAIYDKYADEIKKLFRGLLASKSGKSQLMLDTLTQIPEFYRLAEEYAYYNNISVEEAIKKMSSGFKGFRLDKAQWTEMIKNGNDIKVTVHNLQGVIQLQPKDVILTQLAANMERWQAGIDAFRNWYIWCKSRRELYKLKLESIVNYICEGGHTGAEASKTFVKSTYNKLARNIIDGNEQLRYFNGLLFDEVIQRYRKITNRFQQLSKLELYCKLASKIPSQAMAAHENSEIGILKRNIKNGARGTSIRKLIDQIPTLLPKLCPCMLMSPLSVAQYINLDNEKFDIVIFDEASQMPTSEAVGAIARGKSLIVVGDPKQMPPTSFFATSAVGEEEAYIDDMESILDDCLSLSIPSKYLKWHYRSKHESLISFSNSQYYDGRLLTFPSIDDQKSKVSLHMVEGVYDKGRTRSNINEARAVVNEVIRRLSDPELSKLSIGIVSFSKVQQDKIEDILNEELAKSPRLEALAYEGKEPIFVKNLENVQGDERDVILFSVGYGPDEKGRVWMNFGPLNNSGGERRLNVAVSRARYEMIVFTSMRSDQIDLRRSNALGVYGLKKFLEYAESGNNTLTATNNPNDDQPESVIAQQIAKKLKDNGYDTKMNVGRSQFKIDIAVIDPENPDVFILGILLDGPNYFETKTVRDREIVQPGVLKGLNWNIMRIWTLDWYERADTVIDNVLKKLKFLKTGKIDGGKKLQPYSLLPKSNVEAKKSIKPESKMHQYLYADKVDRPVHDANSDVLAVMRPLLKKQLCQIVKYEQPITNGLLYKRIIKIWKLSRVTSKIQAIIDRALNELQLTCTPNGDNGCVYWNDESFSKNYVIFRENSDREIQDIPLVEIVNAMKYAISQQVAMECEDLKRLTASLFGFQRKSNLTDSATEYALTQLAAEGYIKIEGTKAKVN